MSDTGLDSIHLESQRRENFRKAREHLLGAVGEETRRAASTAPPVQQQAADGSSTLFHKYSDRIPPGLDFVLMDKENIYQLKVGVNTIGRLADNDVPIPDPYLSRRHCAILIHTNGICEIHDVASKNGTFVNGKKIEGPTKLASGDEIRMCDRQYIFVRRADLKDDKSHENTERTESD
jgi:pSer/pThr/pTyr-binding forkhead associated (FHA) protein